MKTHHYKLIIVLLAYVNCEIEIFIQFTKCGIRTDLWRFTKKKIKTLKRIFTERMQMNLKVLA